MSRNKLSVVLALVVIGVVGSLHLHRFTERSFGPKDALEVEVKVVGRLGTGSGVIIKSDDTGSLILTNKHVALMNEIEYPIFELVKTPHIQTFTNFWVQSGSAMYIGIVVDVARNTDLALVFLPDMKNHVVAPIANHQGVNGDPVLLAGAPFGVDGMVTTGFLGRPIVDNNESMIFTSIVAAPGNSGSGVFNPRGEVIGILTAGISGTAAISLITPLFAIKSFVGGRL